MATRRDGGRPPYGEGRAALLDAAIRVIATSGLRGLTVRSVGAEAGVTHGLVRHHFGTRDALIEATLVHAARLSMATSSLEPETGAIDDMVVGLGAVVDDQAEIQAFQFELLLEARRRPELLPHVRQIYGEYMAAVRRELQRAGLDPDPRAEDRSGVLPLIHPACHRSSARASGLRWCPAGRPSP